MPSAQLAGSSTAITASHYVFPISDAVTAAGSDVRLALPSVTVTTQTDRTQQDARQLSAALLSSTATAVQQRGLLIAVRCAHVLWVCGVQLTANCCDACKGE